ncbi:MAG: SAM-dependent methyltransferase [Betaproteobacteria bacterium HGW-Betaproteobacteria-16]|nr:MAG: SAM-dependent methyltransferase [Betaproteobacteria bacterium HGW-Betaproteobacteria-16]
MAEGALFFKTWIKQPIHTGAIAPSGSTLSRLITSEIRADAGPVIELGPGTGAFTRSILARGVRESELVLVERSPDFARLLKQRYPQARLLEMDVSRIRLRCEDWDTIEAQAVISGLPLLNMGLRAQWGIVSACFKRLRPGGCFYQFTYTVHCPIHSQVLERLGLKAERVGGTVRNLPPASVYRISRC